MKKLTEEEFQNLMQQFIDAWGVEGQKLLAIEEMAELTQVLAKHLWRDKDDEEKAAEYEQRIREEIADVLITVAQMRYVFGADEVDKCIDRKLQRGADRLEEWKKEQK